MRSNRSAHISAGERLILATSSADVELKRDEQSAWTVHKRPAKVELQQHGHQQDHKHGRHIHTRPIA